MLRFGIMGAGSIAHGFLEAIQVVDGAELVAVASKSLERAEQWREESAISPDELRCYGDYESFLKDDSVDVVYIATTTNYHYENIKACLHAGKHVLCEKAMVETEERAREVFALAAEKHLFLMEAMWSRFLPRTEIIRNWIREGRIGAVKLLQSSIGFAAPKDPEGRLYNPALGGGALYDIGVYMIDMLPYLADKKILHTDAIVQFASTGVDETIQLSMELEDGILAGGVISFAAKLPEDIYIYGEKGYIRAPKIHWGHEAYLYDENDNQVEAYEIPHGPGFAYEIREVVRCISEGRMTSEIASPEMTYTSSRIYDKYLTQRKIW